MKEFIAELNNQYLKNRSKIESGLTDNELRNNVFLKRCFIIAAILASEDTMEAGFVLWLNEKKNFEKMIDSYELTFKEMPDKSFTYTVNIKEDVEPQ